MSITRTQHNSSRTIRAIMLALLVLVAFIGTYTLASAATPAVTGVSPASGPSGTTVTITGTGFTGATAVSFGGTLVGPVSGTDTQLVVTAPVRAPGLVNVQVTNPDGTSPVVAAGQFTYTATPLPAVTSVSPTSGNAGTLVTITGSGFTGATSVNFGGSLVAPSPISDTQLTALAPAHALGTVNVQVTTPLGTSAVVASGQFAYVSGPPAVTSVSPLSGPAGTVVTVMGSGFTGATSVSFGGTLAAPTSVTDTQLSVIAPAHSPGQVHIQVTTPAGTSVLVVADIFTYTTGQPTVTAVTPASGPVGTLVSITGTGFTGVTSVSFGGTLTAPTSVTDTLVTANAPSRPLGQVHVSVATLVTSSAIGDADLFTYVAAGTPIVASIAPTSGIGGTVVSITGSGFLGATSVSFGSATASPTVVSDVLIVVTAPAHAAGLVNVTVTNATGTSITVATAQFTYTASSAPSISALSPSSGPVTGGTTVVITGSAFTGATAVLFGSTAAAFTVNSDTQITATSPARSAPGAVNVQVSTSTNSSANSASNRYTYLSVNATITSISPSFGPNGTSTVVVITGSGFTGTISVTFGGISAAFTVNSDTRITATSPFHIVGTVDVVVTNPSGSSANTAADNFTYTMGFCPIIPLWTDDLAYGSPGGGFYWDQISGLVWTAQRDWHLFSPVPFRQFPQPLWIDAHTYGSPGGGFYWDPVSGLVWTGQRDWHLYTPQSCIPRP